MHRYPSPNLHDLLLPVIACLPTAFFSPQPPPALLPLLSPILRQRVSLHSQTATAPGTRPNTWENNWLNLLTWSPQRAEQLREICSELQLEPHPVSGELELFEDEPETIEYRHLDAETVQAKCDVRKYGISVVWTWCTNDSGAVGVEALTGASGGEQNTEDGWRIAEVRPVAGTEDETWYPSQAEADEAAPKTLAEVSPSRSTPAPTPTAAPLSAPQPETPASEDDYWALYDRTPAARTPARHSPAPLSTGLNPLTTLDRRDSETEYFARYASEVQPALDAHDPDESAAADASREDFSSTLGPSQSVLDPTRRQLHGQPTPPDESDTGLTSQSKEVAASNSNAGEETYPLPCTEIPSQSTIPPASAPRVLQPSESHDALPTIYQQHHEQSIPYIPHRNGSMQSPQPSRSTSPINKLEREAAVTSAAEVGVKQHISTEMKSLYRLARAAGIDRSEFERVVWREIEVLGMLDDA